MKTNQPPPSANTSSH